MPFGRATSPLLPPLLLPSSSPPSASLPPKHNQKELLHAALGLLEARLKGTSNENTAGCGQGLPAEARAMYKLW